MQDLIIFSNADEHPLARFLKPGFRHVTAVRHEKGGYWTHYDWTPSQVHTVPVGGDLEDLIEYYTSEGGVVIVRNTALRVWRSPPMIINNCVGHTKSLVGIPSFALTPHQLYTYLRKEQSHAHDTPRRWYPRRRQQTTGTAPAPASSEGTA